VGKNDIEAGAGVVDVDDSFWLDQDDRNVHVRAHGAHSPPQFGLNAEQDTSQ